MFRKDLIDMLLDNPMSVRQIAHFVQEPPKDVEGDLRHLFQSLRHTEFVPAVDVAECRKCGFEFPMTKLHKPSKCPECKSTWVTEPHIYIRRKEQKES